MIRQVVKVKGQRFVMVPEAEFQQLELRAARADAGTADLPPLPPPDEDGNYPALDYIRASIARDIVRQRQALGLSQQALAKLAGVRPQTLSQLESGQRSPTVRTVEKIDRALKLAAQRSGSRRDRDARRKPRK